MKKIYFIGLIMIIFIVISIAIVTWSWFAANSKDIPAKEEKNPNIEYIGNGILRISGNNSTELAVNLKEFNWMNSCRMDEDQPLHVATENNKSYILLAINHACASNFK